MAEGTTLQSSGVVCSNAVHHANAQNTIEDKALQRYLKSLEREKQIRLAQIQNNQKLFALKRKNSTSKLPLLRTNSTSGAKNLEKTNEDEKSRRPFTAPVKTSIPEYSVHTKESCANTKTNTERPKTRASTEGKTVKFKGVPTKNGDKVM